MDVNKPHINVSVTEKEINPAVVESNLRKGIGEHASPGAQVSFVGTVRGDDKDGAITSLTLEHYPGMTERKLSMLAERATSNFSLLGIELHHRHGTLLPKEVIVVVSVISAHRKDAFDACRDVVEHLKTDVPFWKKEEGSFGERWVKAKAGEDRPAIGVDE